MDYSMIACKHARKSEMQVAPLGPHCGGHRRGSGPCMDGYINGLDRLSHVRKLDNIELSQTRSMRFNFKDHMNGYDDYYYIHGPHPPQPSLGPPPPSSCRCPGCRAPPPPPPSSCGCPGCRAPPPPPPPPRFPPAANYHSSETPYGPPPRGYPHCGFFNDGYPPNGCSVM